MWQRHGYAFGVNIEEPPSRIGLSDTRPPTSMRGAVYRLTSVAFELRPQVLIGLGVGAGEHDRRLARQGLLEEIHDPLLLVHRSPVDRRGDLSLLVQHL